MPATTIWGFEGSTEMAGTSSGSAPVKGSKNPLLASTQLAPPSVLLKRPTLGTPKGVMVPA